MVFSLKHTNAKLEWAHGFTCKVTSEGDLESSAMHVTDRLFELDTALSRNTPVDNEPRPQSLLA